MFLFLLLLLAGIALLIGLMVLKLIERMMYEHYKQSVPWEKIDIQQTVITYSNEMYGKSVEYIKKYIEKINNNETIKALKEKIQKYTGNSLTSTKE